MQEAAFKLDEYRFTKASSKWLMAHFFHEKTDKHSNESLNTHESTDIHMADTKFGI